MRPHGMVSSSKSTKEEGVGQGKQFMILCVAYATQAAPRMVVIVRRLAGSLRTQQKLSGTYSKQEKKYYLV